MHFKCLQRHVANLYSTIFPQNIFMAEPSKATDRASLGNLSRFKSFTTSEKQIGTLNILLHYFDTILSGVLVIFAVPDVSLFLFVFSKCEKIC